MYICRALGIRLCVAGETFGPGLQYGPAAPLDLFFQTGQAGEEVADHPLHRRPGPQAQVPRCLFPGPAPHSFIAIEVRTVAWQVHQPQVQTGCPQILPHPLAPVRWRLSQITISGLECLSLSCLRKAAEVPELLLPSRSIHSTSAVSKHTAE